VILFRNLVVAKSQWIDWKHVRELKKPSLDEAIAICESKGTYGIMEFQQD